MTSPVTDRSGLNLDPFWMPFTANRAFKKDPRIMVSARDCYYRSDDGREIFDSISGLWCCGAGHNVPEIRDAITAQLQTMDYAPSFQFGHPASFQLADRITDFTPPGLNRVFFTDSGSECADTSLKIARAYWRAAGQPAKTQLIGRAKGYYGVNFGGMSVGGIGANRKSFGAAVEADHLPSTLLAENAFSHGTPQYGEHLAEPLLDIIALRDASNIAAVIVEPVSGSAGVIVPPHGYLQRLREICTDNNILLIFDEVITAFGRCGAKTGAEAFGVVPDIMNIAKQLTNGVVPMGAVIVKEQIYRAFMEQDLPEHGIELPHGYTYSGHPVACAAGLATLDHIESAQLYVRAKALAPTFESLLHALRSCPNVTDIRNFGLAGAITLAPRNGDASIRPYEAGIALWNAGFYVRWGGDTLQFGPPFIATPAQLQSLFDCVASVLDEIA